MNKTKDSMEEKLRAILNKIYRGQKENNNEAVEQILALDCVSNNDSAVCDHEWYYCETSKDLRFPPYCCKCGQHKAN